MASSPAISLVSSRRHILSLPYDIRHLIYEQLFPPCEQIYVQVLGSKLQCMIPEERVPTELMLTCRQLRDEGNAFLYNNYLFNIVGKKRCCLAAHEKFLNTIEKYARNEVRLNAFSNGDHSATMCISLQAGTAKMGVLMRRRRGEPKELKEIQDEEDVSMRSLQSMLLHQLRRFWTSCAGYMHVVVAISSVGIILVAVGAEMARRGVLL